MKKILVLFLTVFLLAGCRTADSGQDTTTETAVPPTEIVPLEETAVPTLHPAPIVTPDPSASGDSLAFSNPGKVRIAYQGNVNDVRYITSADQLPDVEALKGYDAEFFENHALLIVVETYSSGSVQVELEDIRVSGDAAVVSLKRTMNGDVGTADMATWLLWAEVEKGLDYTWLIKDRPQEPAGEKY